MQHSGLCDILRIYIKAASDRCEVIDHMRSGMEPNRSWRRKPRGQDLIPRETGAVTLY